MGSASQTESTLRGADRGRTGRRRISARLVLLPLGLATGLLLGELAVRMSAKLAPGVGTQLQDPLGVLVEPHGELGYRQKPASSFRSGGEIASANAAGYRGPLVTRAKPAGTFRIILLGGSVTHGWGAADSQTIDRHMRDILTAQYPATSVEVVNLAFDGYDSYQLYERLRTDGLPMAPNVVIVNSGINDVRNARFPGLEDRDSRTLIWEGVLKRLRREQELGRPALWTSVKHYSYLARLPGLVRRRLRSSAPRSTQSTATPYPEAMDYFERNIRRIVQLARSHDIDVILSTPPSSLELLYAPTATSSRGYWILDAATTQWYRDSLAARMRLVSRSADSAGNDVRYVAASLEPQHFLDDCHLTSDGNRALANVFAQAVAPHVERWLAARPGAVARR